MAFERISGLFKRGPKVPEQKKPDGETEHADEPRAFQPLPRPNEGNRQELLETLDNGFGQVAGVLHRLDHHLQANTELLNTLTQSQSQLPSLLQAQQKLTQMTANAERGNQAVLNALTTNLKQRDEAQQAAMRQLGLMTQAVTEQRDHYAEQLALVLKLNRNGRWMLVALLLATLALTFVFFVLFMVALLRPDMIKNALSHVGNVQTTEVEKKITVAPEGL